MDWKEEPREGRSDDIKPATGKSTSPHTDTLGLLTGMRLGEERGSELILRGILEGYGFCVDPEEGDLVLHHTHTLPLSLILIIFEIGKAVAHLDKLTLPHVYEVSASE